MELKNKVLSLLILVGFLFLVVQVSSKCHDCYHTKSTQSPMEHKGMEVRVMLKGSHGLLGPTKAAKIKAELSTETEKLAAINGGQLRTAPSGPDPLHHNGGSTKKPKSYP